MSADFHELRLCCTWVTLPDFGAFQKTWIYLAGLDFIGYLRICIYFAKGYPQDLIGFLWLACVW
jgi:hypothetical protein